jgi:hypothetical protein
MKADLDHIFTKLRCLLIYQFSKFTTVTFHLLIDFHVLCSVFLSSLRLTLCWAKQTFLLASVL